MAEDENFYLYLRSTDSTDYHKYNNSISFVSEFPTNISLKGNWECSLLECVCKLSPGFKYGDYIDVEADVVQSTLKHNGWAQLLRRFILGKHNISKRQSILEEKLVDERFIPVIIPSIKRIKVELKVESKDGYILKNKDSPSHIVLQFRRI